MCLIFNFTLILSRKVAKGKGKKSGEKVKISCESFGDVIRNLSNTMMKLFFD